MFRKYKIKKRKNIINPYCIFFIFIIVSIFVSTGYALFTDTLTIKGKANILKKEENPGDDIVYGNSTYNYEITSSWSNGGEEPIHYSVSIPITNLDANYDSWEISFEVEGLVKVDNTWQASSTTVDGNKVTMKCYDWNSGDLKDYGDKFILTILLSVNPHVELNITKLALNGVYVKKE